MKSLDVLSVPLTGIHLVEASAGTGKTHAITTLYLRAVIEQGLLPEQILVVTFTRAATAELRERIRQRLRLARQYLEALRPDLPPASTQAVASPVDATTSSSPKGGASDAALGLKDPVMDRLTQSHSLGRCRLTVERALLVVDEGAVMTIHGFCAKVLEQNAFEGQMPLVTDLIESVDSLVREIVNDFIVTRLAERTEPALCALRSIGVNAASLEELAVRYLKRDAVEIEPAPFDAIAIEGLRDALETHQRRALDWLEQPSNIAQVARLNKSKGPPQLGKRLAGYVEKSRAWLKTPAHQLNDPCQAFERLFELLVKHPSAGTQALLDWFEALRTCNEHYTLYREAALRLGVNVRHEFIAFLTYELEARKLARGIQSYDDLLRRLRDALVRQHGQALAEGLSRRFPLILIDEFQDTDSVQFDVFARIYSGKNGLYLIGDPKQSIYAFRGADVDAYLAAGRDPRVRSHTLDVNWRSDPAMVSALQQLYQAHPDPFLGAGMQYVPVVPRPGATDLTASSGEAMSGLCLLWMNAVRETPRGLPKYLARRLAVAGAVAHVRALLVSQPRGWSKPVRASDIAILTRTHRECQLMAQALRETGIVCVLTSDASVLESDGALSVILLLRSLVLPSDAQRMAALLSDPLIGLEPHALEALREQADTWDTWIERMLGYRRLAERSGILAVVVRICDELELKQRILARPSGERFVTDLFHTAEIVQSNCRRPHFNLEGQLEWLEAARAGDCEAPLEDQQLRIEADSDAVVLTTVHRSKGLQFPFVICPFLWDQRTPRASTYLEYRRDAPASPPSESQQKRQVIHLEARLLDADAAERAQSELEYRREEARLLYVALTRAKHQAAVIGLDVQGFEASPLGFWLRGSLLRGAAETTPMSDMAAALQRALQRLPDPSAVQWQRLDAAAAINGPTAVPRATNLKEPKGLERVVAPTIKTTSYSALTSVSLVHGDIGRDVDALPGQEIRVEPVEFALPPTAMPLAELPPGPRTGEALHEILEHADFRTFDETGGEPDVAAILTRFGIDAARFEVPVRQGIRRILDVALSDTEPELKLGNLVRGSCCTELEFLMKVTDLRADALAEKFTTELSGVRSDYISDIKRLRFDPITGYLRGFIDLVFEYAGRYYVVDYKSNALGADVNAYSPAALGLAMREHHYPIQAALYAAAVDRWLRVARRDYSYEAHFGGVFYLFLRGMAPELGARRGVFFHRPDAHALDEFEAMLEGGAS